MTNFDNISYKKLKEKNANWPQIPDYPYRILITGGSGSGKINALFNLIVHQSHIDKMYFYDKDPFEAKYQLLINQHESVGLKEYNDSEAFVEYSNDMDDIYKNVLEYNPDKEH